MDYRKLILLPTEREPLAYLKGIQEIFRFTYEKSGYYHLKNHNILCVSTVGEGYYISVVGEGYIVFKDVNGKTLEDKVSGATVKEAIENFINAIQYPAYCEVTGHEVQKGINFWFSHCIRLNGHTLDLFEYQQVTTAKELHFV